MPYGPIEAVADANRWHLDNCEIDAAGDDADTCWCHCKNCGANNPHMDKARWRSRYPWE